MSIVVSTDVRLVRNENDEKALTEKARTWLDMDERTPGIHVSDILEPRLAYWRIVDPRPLDERKTWMFLVGRLLHTFVLAAHDEIPFDQMNLQHTDDVTGESGGVSFTPDKILVNGQPAEIKTTRSFYPPKPGNEYHDYQEYLRQILVYTAALNQQRAKMWVLYLNIKDELGTRPDVRCYDIVFTPEDIARVRLQTVETRQLIERSVVDKEYRRLPLCTDWKCIKGDRPECVYWEQCKPEGRYEKWAAKHRVTA